MITNGEGIDYRVGLLNIVTKELVKAVLVNALCANGTVKAAEATALKRILCNIHHTALVRKASTEARNHPSKVRILICVVSDNNDVTLFLLHVSRRAYRHLIVAGWMGDIMLVYFIFTTPEEVAKELLCLLPALIGQKVIHISRKALDVAKSEVTAVVLDISMCGDVVEVLRGCNLGRKLTADVYTVGLQKLDKSVKLTGCYEGIYRIGEDDGISDVKHVTRLGKILLQRSDCLACVEDGEALIREDPLPIFYGLKGDGILSLRASVND
jgi:hypothetical protein